MKAAEYRKKIMDLIDAGVNTTTLLQANLTGIVMKQADGASAGSKRPAGSLLEGQLKWLTARHIITLRSGKWIRVVDRAGTYGEKQTAEVMFKRNGKSINQKIDKRIYLL